MNLEEFEFEMNRLKSVFGERAYPVEKRNLIFKDVRNWPITRFKGVIDEAITNMRYAPLKSDMLEIYRSRFKEYLGINPNKECKFCDENGFVAAMKGGQVWAFGCHKCELGTRKRGIARRWNDSETDNGFELTTPY